MNQKDYLKIAKVISTTIMTEGSRNNLSCRLADYFEEEECLSEIYAGSIGQEYKSEFNRQQFLKNCGVEE